MKNRYTEPVGTKKCGFCQGVRDLLKRGIPKHLRGRFKNTKKSIPTSGIEKKDKRIL